MSETNEITRATVAKANEIEKAEATTRVVPMPIPPDPDDEAAALWDRDAKIVACSQHVHAENYAELVTALLGPITVEMAELVNQEVLATEFVAHVAQVASIEDGELKTMLRLVIRLEDGRVTATCSPSFIRNYSWLAKRMKPEEVSQGLRIRVGKGRSRQGRYYYTCTLAPKQIDGPDSPGAKPKQKR